MNIKDSLVFSYLFNDLQRWPLWAPVLLGVGISLYFSLAKEPSLWWMGGSAFLLCLFMMARRLRALQLFILALFLVSLGFSSSILRTYVLDTRMLQYPLAPLLLEGRVSQVELLPTKKGTFYQRVLLTDLDADTPESLPQTIRLSLKGKRDTLWPGDVIRIRAKLRPISEPPLPREFDFRRQAYFKGIGAAGFALSAPERLKSAPTWMEALEKRREEITDFFLRHMTPPKGAIAAALVTGNKSAIPEETREAFINSGLAHILAISGLHLTIIAGVVFFVIRRGLAFIPSLCLVYNSKKMAAVGTIFMTLLYLILSGFGIPAQRAFIMISLVMGAIVIDRTALSVRTVALAAFVILLISPESLLGPSFQLSFAAVVALITGYESLKNPLGQWMIGGGPFRKFLVYISGLALTSLLATLATLPFTIYLFHRFSLHAIEANLVAVPLTSLVIMPSALLTCLLSPIGLGEGSLWVFEKSLDGLIIIASTVASWPGAHIWVAHPPLLAFILVVSGGLWFCIWQQSWRKWGLLPMALGCGMAFWKDPPHLLIDGQGKLVALYADNTLHLNTARKGKFTAKAWERFLAAKEVKLMACEEGICRSSFQNIPLIISSHKAIQPCEKGAILIRLESSQKSCPEAALTLDWFDLWKGGGHALWLSPKGPRVEKVRALQGKRPWTQRAIPRKERGKKR